MGFTRDNISSGGTFTRDGSVSTVNPPAFQIFDTLSGPNTFSLGPDWQLKTTSGITGELKFQFQGATLLSMDKDGISGIVLGSLHLGNKTTLPSTQIWAHSVGDIVKVLGVNYILQTDGNPND